MPQTSTPVRLNAMFGSGQPGTEDGTDELSWIAASGFNETVNYSLLNAKTGDTEAYLAEAYRLGVVNDLSLKDLLGPADADEDGDNRDFHRQYGDTTDEQVETALRRFAPNPAVRGFYLSDEQPAGLDDLDEWLPRLKHRAGQVRRWGGGKPVICSMVGLSSDEAADRLKFLKTIAPYCDEIWLSYYPIGTGKPGSTAERQARATFQTLAGELQATVGSRGRMIIQNFAWKVEPDTASENGIANPGHAPATDDMVGLYEESGLPNSAWFSFDYAQATSLQQLDRTAAALRKINQA